jgi:undecaprenyl-diphosphatase
MNSLEHAITSWDRSTFLAINHGMKCGLLDFLMPRVSDWGLGHVQVLFILSVAIWRGMLAHQVHLRSFVRDIGRAIYLRRVWVGPMLVAFLISGIASTVVKHYTERDRPAWFYSKEHDAGRARGVEVYGVAGRKPMKVAGFLSGHTATTVAIATAFTLVFRRRKSMRGWIAAAWIMTVLISFSRIYIADHWPIDVVCGALLGLLCGVAALLACRLWANSETDSKVEMQAV